MLRASALRLSPSRVGEPGRQADPKFLQLAERQAGEQRGVPRRAVDRAVFLNIPYDSKFERLGLAYICAVASFGLVPRATIEIPGNRRLDRIIQLIKSCPFSLHDLSRIERQAPLKLPRFNMPFELGLAVGWERFGSKKHTWYVFEAHPHRADKSLSDLAGTDVYSHGGNVGGVLREGSNSFIRERREPTLTEMWTVYRRTRRALPSILGKAGAKSILDGARAFHSTCVSAVEIASEVVPK